MDYHALTVDFSPSRRMLLDALVHLRKQQHQGMFTLRQFASATFC